MAAEKTLALVLGATPFGETSSVVTLLTREIGKLRALAKGAWRPKGPFDGALDLFSTCEVIVLRRASGGLDLLTEACLLERFRIAGSLAAYQATVGLIELTDALTADADPQPELFDAVVASVHSLSGHRGSDDRVDEERIRAALAILHLTGHGPALERCAACLAPVGTGRAAFGMLDGGTLCPSCRRGKRLVVSVSDGALALLRRLVATPPRTILTVDADRLGEARAVVDAYLSHLLGRRLRSASASPQRPGPRRR